LVCTEHRIDTLDLEKLAGNVAWALKRPWLDQRLAPILEQARAALGER
jgi:hypothetical protein